MSNKVKNPMKVITGPQYQMELLQRMAAQVYQRWHAQVQRQPDHPQVGYGHHQQDQKRLSRLPYKEGEAKLKGNGRSVPCTSVLKTPLRDGGCGTSGR